MTLTVLSRTYCHLCEELLAALEAFRRRVGSGSFEIRVVDIDQHPELEVVYGNKVPVLLDGNLEICHYFMNEDALTAHLQRRSGNSRA
jgi:thioredoxin reductase (NADPH)